MGCRGSCRTSGRRAGRRRRPYERLDAENRGLSGRLGCCGLCGSTRPSEDYGSAHHERVDRPLSERLGCCRLCGSTRSSERLRPGSPRTGAPPRQAWDRPLRPNQDRPFRWLRAGSPRTGFGGLLRHAAHGCPGCLSRPCPWVPTRGTPTVDGLTTNEGWEGPRLHAAWAARPCSRWRGSERREGRVPGCAQPGPLAH